MVVTYSAVVELVDESVNLSDFDAEACFVVVKCVMFSSPISDNNLIGSLPFFLSIYGLVNPTDLLFDAQSKFFFALSSR